MAFDDYTDAQKARIEGVSRQTILLRKKAKEAKEAKKAREISRKLGMGWRKHHKKKKGRYGDQRLKPTSASPSGDPPPDDPPPQ